jgi:hypothetical protein
MLKPRSHLWTTLSFLDLKSLQCHSDHSGREENLEPELSIMSLSLSLLFTNEHACKHTYKHNDTWGQFHQTFLAHRKVAGAQNFAVQFQQ